MNSQQTAAVEATGEVFVSAGAGTGKTTVLVERFVRAVCDAGLDVESVLVITYTRKAAGELRARIRAALHARGRPDLARRLDGAWISTIHGFCSRLLRTHPFAVGLDPRFHELADDQAAVLRGEAFERALASFCAVARPGAPASARDLRRAGAAQDADGRLRDAALGRTRPDARAGRACRRPRAARRAAGGGARPRGRRRRDRQAARRGQRRARARLEPRAAARPLRARGARATARPSSARRATGCSRRRSRSSRRATASCCRSCSICSPPSTRRRRQRESALDFEDLQLYARDLLRDHEQIRDRRAAAVPLDHGRRVPGHEPAAVRRRSTCCAAGRARRTSSSSATSSSRSTASGTPTSTSSASGARRRRSGCRWRATTARGPRCSPPSTTCSARSSARGTSRWPRPASSRIRCSAIRSSCSSPTRRATAKPARAWREGEASAIARRVRELVDTGAAAPRRDRAAVRRRHRRRAVRVGAARARACRPTARRAAATSASSRSSTCSSYLRLLHNRYDDEALATVLASPFVGVSNDALVLIRRHAGEAAALRRHRALAARAALRGRRAARARVQAALRAARRRLGAPVARAAVRGDRLGARLRPRRARAVGRQAALREPAQADAARALVRGAARRRHRRLRQVHPRPGGGRRVAARGRLGGGGRRRGPPADDPRREGARVQGRDRRRRRPRHGGRAVDGRDPRSARRQLRLPRDRPEARASARASSATRRCARPRSARIAPSGCASTTSR